MKTKRNRRRGAEKYKAIGPQMAKKEQPVTFIERDYLREEVAEVVNYVKGSYGFGRYHSYHNDYD